MWDHDDVVPLAPDHQRVVAMMMTTTRCLVHAGHLRAARLECAGSSHLRGGGHGREIRVTCAPESPTIPRSGVME